MKKQQLIIYSVAIVVFIIIFVSTTIPQYKQTNNNNQPYKSNIFGNVCRENIVFREMYCLSKYDHVTVHNLYKLFSSHYLNNINISESDKHMWIYSISKYSKKYGIPGSLILSIIWKESSFNKMAVSEKNAKGPMQVMAKYHRDKLSKIGKNEKDLLTIDTGVHIGCMVLKNYYTITNGNIILALQKYYGKKDYTYINDILTKYVLFESYLIVNN